MEEEERREGGTPPSSRLFSSTLNTWGGGGGGGGVGGCLVHVYVCACCIKICVSIVCFVCVFAIQTFNLSQEQRVSGRTDMLLLFKFSSTTDNPSTLSGGISAI